MKQRMNVETAAPEATKAMLGLEKYVRSKIDHRLLELVKLRASILNGCAFCIDMHTRDALASGESTQRLFAVAAWHEAPFFTHEERAALALTDAVTRIDKEGVPDPVWDEARAIWSEAQIGDLLLAIVTINGWNRLAISTRKLPTEAPAPHAAAK